jgi:DNA ligase-1
MNPALLTTDIPDPAGWWVSTKLDGVRMIWTGSALLSRSGRRLLAPQWFTEALPRCRMDGELWMGNESFNRLVSALQTKGGSWTGVEYHVFDLAEAGTFEERMDRLAKIPLPAHVHIVPHRVCTGMADLDRTEREVVEHGGEGCVIRRPGSLYRPGRSGDIIKIKRLVKDVEHSI